jgi:rubrerythrin
MLERMPDTKTDQYLAQAFARLSKGAARKKIYSRQAVKEGRPEVARLLRAMSASETVQARRLFNSLIGRVDTSDEYVTTIFAKEVQGLLENYTEFIDNGAAERPALLHALAQLKAAETRLLSFYSPDSRDVTVKKDGRYFVCGFCGYLSIDSPPEKCPICSASREAFQEIT